MKIRQRIVATLATVTLLVPTMIRAADHFGPGGMGAGPFGMGGASVLRLAHKLGLGSDQVMQYNQLRAQSAEWKQSGPGRS
ncbi:MAG: hypothetical protein ABR961_09015 [Thermoanaerobaculaceae bacterium]|jgi:hypothetical protein